MDNLPQFKRSIVPGLLIISGFFVLDVLWIGVLPFLNISYGSFGSVLIIFFVLRMSILFMWLFIMVWIPKWRTSSKNGIPILILTLPNLLLFGIGLYGFYVEPFHLTVNRIEVPVKGLQKNVRIVQLSDIHVERTTKREKKLPALVASLNPDMIVLTGDYVNESYTNIPETIADLRTLIDQLDAPIGIYAVNGNVETPSRLKELMQDLDVTVLDNQVLRLPEISDNFVLIGLSFHIWSFDANQLHQLMKSIQPDDFSMLLYHKPDIAYTADEEGVDLYLAGHTHGGQVRLPFYGAIFTNSRYGKAFEMGYYQMKHTTLYVNRGLGFTGGPAPRIRFLAPPEVLVIDLIPK